MAKGEKTVTLYDPVTREPTETRAIQVETTDRPVVYKPTRKDRQMEDLTGAGPQRGLYGDRGRKPQAPADQAAKPKAAKKEPTERLNLKLPTTQKRYLQEMAWRRRMSLTQYLSALIQADMDQNPGWEDSLDELND